MLSILAVEMIKATISETTILNAYCSILPFQSPMNTQEE